MYTLLRNATTTRLWIQQLPVFVVSLLIAETQYKFHSFTLECLAFLATWFAIDLVVERIRERITRR